MDTKQFLESVLPTEGTYCVGTLKNKVFQNFFGDTIDWAAEIAAGIDGRQRNTYFALASYKAKGSRTQDNVLWVKALWLDIDTQESKPNEPYADRKVAVQELRKFCTSVGLPSPMLVSSGYGIHAYWPLTDNIDGDTWKGTATLLKQACRVWGLAADASRTSDSASVLRPVGMRNFKMDAPKEVKLLTTVDPTPFSGIHDALVAYLTANKAMPSVPLPKVENINSDLMTQPTALPSSGHRIAKHCAVIQKLRDTAGDLPQPEWYYGLQVVAFTEEADALCHEWSMGHPQYDARETQAKIDQAKRYAPTSCDKLREFNESACAACPHFGKIKSPIVLGTEKHEPQYIQIPGTTEIPDQPHKFLPMMPKGFGWGPVKNEAGAKPMLWGTTFVKIEKDDGTTGWDQEKTPITDSLFFPVARIRDDAKAHSMMICVWRHDGTQDEFIIDNSLAVDLRELQKELARREIVIMNNAENLLKDYLKAWIADLRDNSQITASSPQFGWTDDGFLVADKIVTPDGERTAILTGTAFKMVKHMMPKGSLDMWINHVDRLYNHRGLEHHQYCILASFASPLIELLGVGGALIYAYSAEGGDGKTTAQQVAFSVWGNTKKGELILARDSFTENGVEGQCGALRNLPLVIDELSSCTPEFAGDFLYAVENGSGKKRMSRDLSLRESQNWALIAMGSGNKRFSEKVLSVDPDATAKLMRLWEFSLDGDPQFAIDVNEANVLTAQLLQCWGHAGPIYAKYLVDNREAVTARLIQTRADFVSKHNITPKERYWSALHACVLMAQELTSQLGLLRFDRQGIENWIASELANTRGVVVHSKSTPLELMSKMLSDLFPGILVTVGEGSLHRANPESAHVEHHPRGEVWGRHVLPKGMDPERMHISTSAARAWCTKNNTSLEFIWSEMAKLQIFKKEDERVSFGRGVRQYSGVGGGVRSISVDMNRLRGSGAQLPFAPIVQAVQSAPPQSDSVDMAGAA